MAESRLPALFREANREFEQGEDELSGWVEPASPCLGAEAGAAAPASPRCPEPEGPPAAHVALAVKEMELLMGEFGVDLATVTQAFLKNSGEAAAAASCLRTGRRPDGQPLWSRQDDEDLLEGLERARSHLEAKYGAESVNKRLLFRGSLCQE